MGGLRLARYGHIFPMHFGLGRQTHTKEFILGDMFFLRFAIVLFMLKVALHLFLFWFLVSYPFQGTQLV